MKFCITFHLFLSTADSPSDLPPDVPKNLIAKCNLQIETGMAWQLSSHWQMWIQIKRVVAVLLRGGQGDTSMSDVQSQSSVSARQEILIPHFSSSWYKAPGLELNLSGLTVCPFTTAPIIFIKQTSWLQPCWFLIKKQKTEEQLCVEMLKLSKYNWMKGLGFILNTFVVSLNHGIFPGHI